MVTIEQYLDALASDAPTPGGGSAAAIVGAAGAALAEMVARICESKAAYAQWRELAFDVIREAGAVRMQLLAVRERDEAAYAAVVAAQALPKNTDAERQERREKLEAALQRAAAEPLLSARLALDVVTLARKTLEIPNRNLASDVGCAGEFAGAALAACAYNVRVNHRFMRDTETIAAQERQLSGYETEAAATLETIRAAVAERLARP